MDSLRWQQAKALVAAVLGQQPNDRSGFLSQHCADLALLAEIDALLRHQDEPTTTSQSIGVDADDGGDLAPGSRVGSYVIIERLGRGGMGEVFLGSDPRLHRKVALKCLLRSSDAVGDSRSRILREARAAARIKHPNVATVHDLIEHAGRAFIVMEYVEGESLAARLQRAQLPVSSVMAIGRQLASALSAAHAEGIVHRDLKPANIQVTPDGTVKVLDFGVATAIAFLSTMVTASITSGEGAELRGFHPGTLGYMSPEQMLGRDVGPRSDIFSLGVVLHEMAAGRRLYRGSDPFEILGAVLKTPTPVHELNPEAPPRLSEIIAKALEADPDRRFESASELERALDGLERSHDPARVGPDNPSAGELAGIGNVPASEFRGRLLLAKSAADLRRLKYELEGYLSTRPQDVDGRMLSDEIERAIGLNVLASGDQPKVGRHQETMSTRSRRSYYRSAAFTAVAVAVLYGGLWLRSAWRRPDLRYAEQGSGALSQQSSQPVQVVPPKHDSPDVAQGPSSLPPSVAPAPSTRFPLSVRRPAQFDAVLVAGIPRAPGESPAQYSVRANSVQDNYSRGKASLEKKDYRAALDRLSAVERDQPGYQNAGALLTQARTELHEAAREAMDNAAKNEAAGEWYAALQWYRHAEQFGFTDELRQKIPVVQRRVETEADSAFERAKVLLMLNESAKAILAYQKVRDGLSPSDERSKEALKQLQVLLPHEPLSVDTRGIVASPSAPSGQRAAAARREADERGIRQVLIQYEVAYNTRDAAAVVRLGVPSIDRRTLARQFAELRSYSVALKGIQIDLEGDTATVTCDKDSVEAFNRGGSSLRRRVPATFELRRSGSSWKIETVK
jgi:serine/threonine protein kinase